MLLGSCHCGQTPPPPSESVSSESIATEISTCAFGTCIGQVFPVRYKLTYNFGSTLFCAASYQGEFTLTFRGNIPTSYGGGGCFWSSDAKSLQYYAGTPPECLIAPFPRFYLVMYKNTIGYGSQKYRVILSVYAGVSQYIPLQMAIVSYVSMLSLPGTQLNCLSAFTLPLENPSYYDRLFSSLLTGVNTHSGPGSVTLTPT